MRSTIIITTGVPGAGKTYSRGACFVPQQFLPEYGGSYYSNLPLHVDIIAERYEKRNKVPAAEVVERINSIPDNVLQSWKEEQSGPWEYFDGVDLSGCHIAIDEAHKYIGAGVSTAYARQWQEFCGELRHRQCSIEFMTQNEDKLHKAIYKDAALKYRIVNSSSERDPFFKVMMAEWYNLLACFTREYTPAVWQEEYRNVGERWVIQKKHPWRFDARNYDLYDSFSRPDGTVVDSVRQKEWFEDTKPWAGPFVFLKRNLWEMAPGMAAFAIIISLFVFAKPISSLYFKLMTSRFEGGNVVAEEEQAKKTEEAGPQLTALEKAQQKKMREMQGQITTLMAKNNVIIKKRRKVYELIEKGTDIVLMSGESIVMRDGTRLGIGDEILHGDRKGKRIESIDYSAKRVLFDDGDSYTFGRYRLPDVTEALEKATAEESRLSATLPTNQPGSQEREATEKQRPYPDTLRR